MWHFSGCCIEKNALNGKFYGKMFGRLNNFIYFWGR